MRVRYGKPIKVKSLFNYKSLTTYFQNLFIGGAKAWGDNLFTSTDNKDYLYSIFEPNKKYYVWIKATCVEYNGEGKEESSNFANLFWFSNMFVESRPLMSHYLKFTGDTFETSVQLQTKSDPDFSSATYWYWYTNRYTDGTLNKVKFDMVIFEIDEAQGLTKEYYDNHKTNFPLIATGEEITIDDKAGQIAYENLNDSVIRCKIAGGSSDIYYGYNNIFNCDTFSGNTIGGGTVSLNDEGVYTYTFGSTIASNAYTNMILDSKCQLVQNHKYLFVLRIKAPHTGRFYTRGFQSYDVTTANTWQDFTCIKTGPSQSSSFYISPDNPLNHGYQQGESYQIVALIIDLTWWFGEGKEPTTVAEFRERFAKDYYGACLTPIKLTEKLINAEPLYGYNQLVQINTSGGAGGMSWNQMDGLVTLSGTPTGTYFNPFYAKQIYTGDVYFISVNVVSNSLNKSFQFGTLNSNVRLFGLTKGLTESIQTANSTINSSIGIADVTANSNLGEIKAYFHLINLTDWYGQGNEPTTVAEFRATFPNKYYPYSLKRLLNKYMINNLLN